MGYPTREKRYTGAKATGTPQTRRLSSGSCARGSQPPPETGTKGESLCSKKAKQPWK